MHWGTIPILLGNRAKYARSASQPSAHPLDPAQHVARPGFFGPYRMSGERDEGVFERRLAQRERANLDREASQARQKRFAALDRELEPALGLLHLDAQPLGKLARGALVIGGRKRDALFSGAMAQRFGRAL